MKQVGLIGGISWHSTAEYYRQINEGVQQARGGRYAARILLHSVNFHDIHALQQQAAWDQLAEMFVDIACKLERAGCDGIAICANTMHKVAPEILAHLTIPLIHVADATANALSAHGAKTAGLLGTRFTMSDTFYRDALLRHGIESLVPDDIEQSRLNEIIMDELTCGVLREESRAGYVQAIDALVARGAQAVILGCTEIPLLIQQEHVQVPAIDTLAVHAAAIVRFALS